MALRFRIGRHAELEVDDALDGRIEARIMWSGYSSAHCTTKQNRKRMAELLRAAASALEGFSTAADAARSSSP